jgi:hypothetical protein
MQHDTRAGTRQGLDDGASDAARAAGDDCRFAVEVDHRNAPGIFLRRGALSLSAVAAPEIQNEATPMRCMSEDYFAMRAQG